MSIQSVIFFIVIQVVFYCVLKKHCNKDLRDDVGFEI